VGWLGLEGGAGVGFGEDLGAGDLDEVFAAEEFHEEVDPVLGAAEVAVADVGDPAFEAAHGALGDFHPLADFKVAGQFLDGLVVHLGLDGGDGFRGDAGEVAAKFHDAQDALGGADGAQGEGGVEVGEEVAGEEGFDEPDLAAAGVALEFDAGAVGLDAGEVVEGGGGEVFGLGFAVQHKPAGRGRGRVAGGLVGPGGGWLWGGGHGLGWQMGYNKAGGAGSLVCVGGGFVAGWGMLQSLHDYLYHLEPEGGLPMKPVGLVIGLALLLSHLWAWRNAPRVQAFLKVFPRHYGWGVALSVPAFLWAMLLLACVDMGEFFFLRRYFLLGLPVGFVLIVTQVREFLAVRALGCLMLLAAGPVLASAFLQPQSSRLLLPILAYAWILGGLYLVGMPYLLRDAIGWVLKRAWAWQAAVWGGVVYGLALLIAALLWY
jgi:hypothetical protein